MLKTNVIFVLLLSFYIAYGLKIEVDLDNERDVIIYKGKTYYPSNFRIKQETSTTLHDTDKDTVNHLEHEEELAEGAQFWIYLFIILCNISFL